MTLPKRNTRTSALQHLGDETSGNKAEMSQARPTDDSSSSTESLPTKRGSKRRKSEGPTPQPQMARNRCRTVPRNSKGPISALRTGAVADGVKENSADHTDLASEQRQLFDENTAVIGRFADPQTPPNRPRLLTENGYLTIVPVSEGSPSDQDTSQRTRDPSKEGMTFGDWLPGHRPRADDSPSLGPRHQRQDGSPSNRKIRQRPRGSRREAIDFGDWLPGQRPQTNNASCLGPRHDHQENESVGAPNRRPRPWEL